MYRLTMTMLLLVLAMPAVSAEFALEKLANNIYVHHGVHEDLSEGYHGDICNISFIIGSKGVAVIDTGGSFKTGKQLREAIRQITSLPILYVINTHVHPDHIFGNAAFLQDHPTYVGHTKLADAMERHKESYLRMNNTWLGAEFAGSELIKPSIGIQNTTELDIGERTLTLTAHPVAHTNTDLTVLDNQTGTLWTGDLLFVDRTPSIDGDIKGWINVINQLKDTSATQVVPGHGPVVQDGKSAFNNESRYLNTLLSDIRDSIKKGEIMEKSMDHAASSEKSNWILFDIVNRRNVNNLYPVLEWE